MKPIDATEPLVADDGDLAPSLVQLVVDGVIDGVRAGRYAPGQRLISADLAADFDVSRAPVREALSVLSGEGIVELVPNRGAKIRTFEMGDLISFLELTESICALGVRLTCRRVADPEVQEGLESAFQRVREAWAEREPNRFVQSLYDYHRAINGFSGNQFVHRFYNQSYFVFFNRLVADRIPSSAWPNYIQNYEMVHDTLLSGQEHAATSTFAMHMQWLLRALERGEDKPPGPRRSLRPLRARSAQATAKGGQKR